MGTTKETIPEAIDELEKAFLNHEHKEMCDRESEIVRHNQNNPESILWRYDEKPE